MLTNHIPALLAATAAAALLTALARAHLPAPTTAARTVTPVTPIALTTIATSTAYIVRPDGSGLANVMGNEAPNYAYSPRWAPEGHTIAVITYPTSPDGEHFIIGIIHADSIAADPGYLSPAPDSSSLP